MYRLGRMRSENSNGQEYTEWQAFNNHLRHRSHPRSIADLVPSAWHSPEEKDRPNGANDDRSKADYTKQFEHLGPSPRIDAVTA